MGVITFRPLAKSDLGDLVRWLARPHVRQWWSGPTDVEAVADKYQPRIDGTIPTEVFVIELDGHAVGIIQRYRVADHPDHERALATTAVDLRSAASLDYLVGEPELAGRGIGSAAIAAFTERLYADLADVDLVAVTPQAANVASCRALERAGYRLTWTGRLDSDDPSDAGEAALYLHHRPDA